MALPHIGSVEEAAVGSLEYALGFGAGLALAEALRPVATQLGQTVWAADPTKAVDAGTAAAIVAEDVEQIGWGKNEANQHGIDNERFEAIVGEILNAPGIGELLRMLRRGSIDAEAFRHGLRKAKQETRWDGPLADLEHERLDPAVIATAIQRSIIADPGFLPVEPPTEAGRVPPMPRAEIDAIAEAAASGIGRERLAAMTRIVGLPPAVGELLALVNRGHITRADFDRGIAEGNTRNEWRDVLHELRRRLLTPHEYVELRLRGWIDDAHMHNGAALSGMEAADTDLLHLMVGRPLSFRQVFIGERRGGHYNGSRDGIDAAFLKALEESNIRPEWYELAWAQRFSYPSAFVLRRLAQDGAIDRDELHRIFLYVGWEPSLAAKVADAYAGTAHSAAKPETLAQRTAEFEGGAITETQFRAAVRELGHSGPEVDRIVGLALDRLVWQARQARLRKIETAFVAHRLTQQQAEEELAAFELVGPVQEKLLAEWEAEREANVSRLTAAQVKKAFRSAIYTRGRALEELTDRGYDAEDAATFLDE